MNEKTLVKTVRLRPGEDWAWYADSNIVGLAPHLDEEGRERALSEVQDFWRRECLRVVAGDAAPAPQASWAPSPIRSVVEAL